MGKTEPITQALQYGIEAAKAGRKGTARQLLVEVVRQSPNNVTALCWLASVAPAPQDSLTLLQRALALEPDNRQAQAGLRWAKKQVAQTATAQAESNKTAKPLTRSQLLTGDQPLQEQAYKGAVAQRARRTITPFTAVALLLAMGALLVAGIWLLALTPPATLARWLPNAAHTLVAAQPAEANAAPVSATNKANNQPPAPAPTAKAKETEIETVARLHSALLIDTIDPGQIRPEPPQQAPVNSTLSEPAALQLMTPQVETMLVDYQQAAPAPEPAFDLVGPVGEAVTGYKIGQAVDESLLAHQPAFPGEKWIEVDLSRQIVTAWEGNVPVLSFLTSTGLPNTPTVQGKYNIYWKLESTLMAGPGYYLPDVPYTMYFYSGYALHGAYWHNNFGQPMSHGCVNLSNDNAKTLFEWADPVIPPGQAQVVSSAANPGTLVVVHQ